LRDDNHNYNLDLEYVNFSGLGHHRRSCPQQLKFHFHFWMQNCLVREGVNIVNLLSATLSPIFLRQKIAKLNIIREKLLNSFLYKKRLRKMLMKLTKGWSSL
jgi:hypothetical protein